jgi:hypothetical protein
MKKWRVGLCYTGYAWQEVEAETEGEAWDIALGIACNPSYDPEITDWERWGETDQIYENK